MTELDIKKYYKVLTVITLVISIFYILISDEQSTEKYWAALGLNIAFHIVYFFVSRAPVGQFELLEKSNLQIRSISLKILKGISVFLVIASVIATCSILVRTFTTQQYETLPGVMIFGALFLGGFLSKLKLDQK